MNKTKLLSAAVITLLVLNFGILGFLFLSKKMSLMEEKCQEKL